MVRTDPRIFAPVVYGCKNGSEQVSSASSILTQELMTPSSGDVSIPVTVGLPEDHMVRFTRMDAARWEIFN